MRGMDAFAVFFIFGIAAAGVASGAPKPTPAEPTPVPTPVVATGTLQGAPYRIDIPDHWNGSLVMLMHGYEPKGMSRDEPWPQNEAAPVFLQRGYAVAASAYTTQGWAVAEALPDNERLRQFFATSYARPRHTYVVGISLGGHEALASLEKHGADYDGALSLCGVNVPASEVFADGIVTPLVALEYFFPKAIPLGKGGLVDPDSPPMLDPEAIEGEFKTDEVRTSILAQRLQIPRPMLAGAMMLDYMVLREMQQRAGGQPVDNTKTIYSGFGDDVAFNRDARRYPGSPAAMAYLKSNFQLTGRIGKPVVLQSVAIDQTVPPRFATRYPELARNAGTTRELTVLPAVGEGHCNLTGEQIGKAFDVLVGK
jgi:pimeloyl-ACP methyl ester carboxylesterase